MLDELKYHDPTTGQIMTRAAAQFAVTEIEGLTAVNKALLHSHERLLIVMHTAAITLESLVTVLPNKEDQAFAKMGIELIHKEVSQAKKVNKPHE